MRELFVGSALLNLILVFWYKYRRVYLVNFRVIRAQTPYKAAVAYARIWLDTDEEVKEDDNGFVCGQSSIQVMRLL